MEKLKSDLSKSSRNLKEVTIKKYLNDFEKITKYFLKNKQFKSYSFLKDTDKVIIYLDSLYKNQRFAQVKAICVVLNVEKGVFRRGYKQVLKFYQKYLTNLVKKYNQEKATGKKTDKESANWIDWISITKHMDNLYNNFYNKYFDDSGDWKVDLKKCGINELKETQLLMILGLYIYLPPRRLEYAYTLYITLNEFENLSEKDIDNNIYLVHCSIKSNFISFGKNKVKNKTFNNLQIKLTEKLNRINSVYINLNYFQRSERYGNSLLFNKNLTQMSTVTLSQNLQTHFKKYFNKNVSVTLMRKAYRTYKLGPIKDLIKSAKEDSLKMNHSLDMGLNHYCKN